MKIYPNAKINIGLNIVSKRTDGYHTIETIFYPVNWCDELHLSEDIDTEQKGKCDLKVEGLPIDSDHGTNIVEKAYHLLSNDFHLPSISVILKKQIPLGAGLGGGSSDGACMLKALNELFQLKLCNSQLESYASKLGADCPFFVANKPSYATGIGNDLTPIDLDLSRYYLRIVKPSLHISTPLAYSQIVPQSPRYQLLQSIRGPITEWKYIIANDFETPLFKLYPFLKSIKEALYESGALYASMSGSGSTIYGIFQHKPSENQAFVNYSVFDTSL